ncbi:MAG: MotA/TolQ/ExbB proton channel family protein [Limnohabitans sp.]
MKPLNAPIAAQALRAAGRLARPLTMALSLGLASAAQAQSPEANPYGLAALWAQGDWIAKITLLILVVMSLASWGVMISKWLEQSRVLRQARQSSGFWQAASVAEGAQALDPSSPFRMIAERGIESTQRHPGLLQSVDIHTWLTMGLQRAVNAVQGRLQGGLAVLATVGSTAPFVGLFGTVWGIYNALVRIGVSGQASIDKVAGPVGESLIMTAIGLAVAVPAVLGYNALVRRNKTVMETVQDFAADLHAALLSQQDRKA